MKKDIFYLSTIHPSTVTVFVLSESLRLDVDQRGGLVMTHVSRWFFWNGLFVAVPDDQIVSVFCYTTTRS